LALESDRPNLSKNHTKMIAKPNPNRIERNKTLENEEYPNTKNVCLREKCDCGAGSNVAHHPPQITLNSQQKTSGGRVHGRGYAAFSDDFNSKSCIAIQNGKVII
jgi:hypothetical protein